MTDILIGTHSRNSWQRPGTTATLRVWFSEGFRDSNGIMVTPGNGTSSFYQIIPCTVNPTTHIVTIPAFTLPSTLDGLPATILSYGRLYDESNAPREFLWSGWSLSNNPASLPFDDWFIFNQGSSLSNAPESYLNSVEVLALINSLISSISQGIRSEVPAGVINGVNGTFTLSDTPVVGSLLLFLNGSLQEEGSLGAGTESYTLSGPTITHNLPPQTGDWLYAVFRTVSPLVSTPTTATQMIETGGPTVLTMGAIGDLQLFQRSGSTIIGTNQNLTNVRLAKTATYALANADRGKTIALGGGAYYTLTVAAASGFDSDFMTLILNEDSVRAKKISINGLTDFFLFPGQTAILYNQNSAWKVYRNHRWQCPGGTTVFVDGTLGNDANDGLAVGTGAVATPQVAINLIKANFDLANVGASPVVVQIADGTYTASGPVINVHGQFFGYQPTTTTFPSANEAPLIIRGNVATPANVVLHSTGGQTGCVLAILGPTVAIEGVKITSAIYGLRVAAATMLFGNVIFGACPTAKIFLSHYGLIENYTNFSIEGNSNNFILNDFGSSVFLTSATITLLSNIVCQHFVISQNNSDMTFAAITIDLNGFTVTGVRFAAQSGGCISTGTSNLTYFPGTTAGFVDGFASYDNMTIYNLVVDGSQTFQGRGTGNVMVGEWGFGNGYGAISLNGSLAAGSANFGSGPGDTNLYVNRPTGKDIIVRENNAFGPSQMTLKATTGNLGIGVDVPTSGLQILLAKIPAFANNAAAAAGGLTAGAFYRTGADPDVLCIVH